MRDSSCSCNSHTDAPRASSQGLARPSLPLQRMNCGVLADSNAEFRSKQGGRVMNTRFSIRSLNSLHRMAPTYRVVVFRIPTTPSKCLLEREWPVSPLLCPPRTEDRVKWYQKLHFLALVPGLSPGPVLSTVLVFPELCLGTRKALRKEKICGDL